MQNRLKTLLVKEIYLVHRNGFGAITLIVALLFVIAVNVFIPEELVMEPTAYILDGSQSGMEDVTERLTERDNGVLVSSRAELERSLRERAGSFGVILNESSGHPAVEFLMQGYESQAIREILKVEMAAQFNTLGGSQASVPIEYTGPDKSSVSMPFNHSLLPMFLLAEPVLMGLFFIASLMFFEKVEGTVTAYAVSPGRMLEYLGAKVLVMSMLGAASALIVTLLTVGFGVDGLSLAAAAISGSFFGSSLGLLISSMFDNLSKAMVWIIFSSLVLTAPFAAYYLPSFSPVWIRVIPSYGLLFALKEAVYMTGDTALVLKSVLSTSALGLVLFVLAHRRYSRLTV